MNRFKQKPIYILNNEKPNLTPPSNSHTLVASLIPSRLAEEFSLGNLTYQDESPKTPDIKNIPMKHPGLCEA